MTKTTEWISVNDKLPELERTVLIYAPGQDDEIRLAELNLGKDNILFWFYPENYGWTAEEVTHWMPLPEEPK